MLRKTIFGFTAAATLGAAALIPTSASAHPGWGGGWHGGWYGGGWHSAWFAPTFGLYAGPVYDDCLVHKVVQTSHGKAVRWVNVCY